MATSAESRRTFSKDGSVHVTDEFYNTLISAIGALFSLAGVVLLVSSSLRGHKPTHLVSFSIYGVTLVNLFIASTLHHGVEGSERTNHLLRELGYYAIFLMIAGSFTPFCLILLRDKLGWSILNSIWLLAILGILLKALWPGLPKWLSTVLYISMGWLGLAIAYPIYQRISEGLLLIILGGLFFTIGAIIFYLEKPNPVPGKFGFHEIWHLFVLAGVASHYCVMYFYLLPF